MAILFKYLKSFIIFFISLLIIPGILTIFNLFNIHINRIIIIIISSILMLVIGFITGINSNSKGYLNGILISTISVLFMLLLSLIFRVSININSLIYYVIIIFSGCFGSMIGINKKNKSIS